MVACRVALRGLRPITRMPNPETMCGMNDGRGFVLAQISAHPGNAFSADKVVCIHHVLDPGDCCNVAADHNLRVRAVFADQPAHLADLSDIHDDRREPDDVIPVGW